MKKAVLTFILSCLLIPFSNAHFQDNFLANNIEITLKEAEDHLVVLPERTLNILSKNSQQLDAAPPEQQARWRGTQMIAAIRVAELDTLQQALLAFSALTKTQYYQSHQPQILNGLGVWLRRSGYINNAKSSYFCSLQHSTTRQEKLWALLNLGVVERNLKHYDDAKKLYFLALDIATKNQLTTYIAVIENNLGILAIIEQRYEAARVHFSKALELNEKLHRRSGELVSSMNLLLTFLYQNNPLYFERVKPRAKRKLLLSPDNARSSYFNVLDAIHNARTAQTELDESRQIILENMEQLNDNAIKELLAPLIADLGVQYELQPQPTESIYRGALLDQFPNCNWQLNSDNANIQKIVAMLADSLSQD